MRWFFPWWKGTSTTEAKTRQTRTRSRPLSVEPLEDRLTPSTALDAWTLRHDIRDTRIDAEDRYAHSTDSSVLAWAESYVLSSYLAMHEATGDTKYLDQFAAQANLILDNASDRNNDGFLGWGTYRYSVSLTQNPGFEAASSKDETLPWGWVRFQSTVNTAYRDPSRSKGGSFGATVRTNPVFGRQILATSTWNALVHDNKPYEPNTLYQLSFYGKTNGSKAGGRVEVYDATTGTVLTYVNFQNRNWKTHSITFHTPAAGGHNLQVRLTHSDYRVAGGSASFDLVRVRQYAEYAVHAGMIAAPMAQFSAVIHDNPALQEQYQVSADRFSNFVNDEILPQWEKYYRAIGATGGTYVFPDDGSSVIPRNSVPHNHYLALGRAMLWLSEADGDQALADRATKLGNTFKRHLHVASGGAYVWNYSDRVLPGDYSVHHAAEDVSHANVDIGFVVAANDAGLVFLSSDIHRFTTTLTRTMWNRSLSSPLVRHRVDGSGSLQRPTTLSEWATLTAPNGKSRAWGIVSAIFNYRKRWSKAGPSGLLTMARLAENSPKPQASTDPTLLSTGSATPAQAPPIESPATSNPILDAPIWIPPEESAKSAEPTLPTEPRKV